MHLGNILIVEDDRKDRTMLIKGLEEVANCFIAENGEEALQIYNDWRKEKKFFDFLLLDVTMQNKGGFEVLKTIRKIEDSMEAAVRHETRILMITSFKDSLMERYNMGWDDFITKPVDLAILINRLNEIQSSSKSEKVS